MQHLFRLGSLQLWFPLNPRLQLIKGSVTQRTEGELEQEAEVTGNQTKLTLCSVKDNLFLNTHNNPLPSSWHSAFPSWGASGWPHGVTTLHLALDTSGVKVLHTCGNIGPLEEREGGKEVGMQGSI